MKTSRERLSRGEAMLLAAAVLLPVPLFAQSGLSVPLPGVVERGLGSLVTIDATDGRSGTTATGQASENGQAERRSGRATLRVTRGKSLPVTEDGTSSAGESGSTASEKPAGDSGSGTPAGGSPEGAGDDGSDGSPGNPGPTENAGNGSVGESSTGSAGGPGVSVGASGQGSKTGVSAGQEGISVDLLAENGGAGSSDAGDVRVDVTGQDASRTGVGATVPGVGTTVPSVGAPVPGVGAALP